MKDKQSRITAVRADSKATNAGIRAESAQADAAEALAYTTRLDEAAGTAVKALAQAQAKLAAAFQAEVLVNDLVEAAQRRKLAEHSERIEKLEAQVAKLTDDLAEATPAVPYGTEPVDAESVLDAAIDAERPVEFIYHKGDGTEPSFRQVSPYDFRDATNGARLLVGYDHDKEGIRQFRIEGIESVEFVPAEDDLAFVPPFSGGDAA